ncbi:MAG TPA: hypothetical protein VJV79_28410 [Polyangiaceae bacterium]|nr:hypothetical protein [Polyangiaceae bacterium]
MRSLIMSSLFGRCQALLLAAMLGCACSGTKKNDDACTPDDADGVISEPAARLLTVTDSEFEPKLLSTQNTSEITLTLKNIGARPHSFIVDCLPTPNSDGCPLESCFPSESKIEPVEPGEQVTVVFETPLVEGIYVFRSDVAEDAEFEPGQFIIQ